jgi:hypothetical protein
LFGDRSADKDLDGEIEMHLRLLTERYVRQGMTQDEAASAARRQFGNITLLKEENREMRSIRLIDTFFIALTTHTLPKDGRSLGSCRLDSGSSDILIYGCRSSLKGGAMWRH